MHRSSKNRLVYALTDCPRSVDELRRRNFLEETEAFRKYISEQEQKKATIEPDFCRTPALSNGEWKKPERSNGGILTRFSRHGYHHVICKTQTYNEPDQSQCICKLSAQECDRYHARHYENASSLRKLTETLDEAKLS